jgi:hypothetical protein
MPVRPAGSSGTGAADGPGGASGTGAADGPGGASGTETCPSETAVAPPSPSQSCVASLRELGEVLTCEPAGCDALERVVDLECDALPLAPSIAAGGATTTVFAYTQGEDDAVAHLLTVEGDSLRVDDTPELADPRATLPAYSIMNGRVSADASGARWLFAGEAAELTALRETAAGWARSSVVPPQDPFASQGAHLTDVAMVAPELGFLTYREVGSQSPHLVTWDGSCWSDELLAVAGSSAVRLDLDAAQRPWLSWLTQDAAAWGIAVLSPDGVRRTLQHEQLSYTEAWRLLPGGFSGTEELPVALVRLEDGLHVLSAAEDEGTQDRTVPDSGPGVISGDCPGTNRAFQFEDPDPCAGQTECEERLLGASSLFAVTRTASGTAFAVWVAYDSEGTFTLENACDGAGEMGPECWCQRTETTGSGTADLVIARLLDRGPTSAHVRFAIEGAGTSSARPVVAAAQGETLRIAAYLGGSADRRLSYLELDTRQLP